MPRELDKLALLKRLEPVQPEEKPGAEAEFFKKIHLGTALLALAEIDHERELKLCRQAAEHLLGQVPEPEELEEEKE